ncbi:SRPBCC family protein [Streptosporangium sp. NPDC050855]|uniref:SRPBCC family protein n=1 Tax=Streptosporangium sp. NPDC050855 TaxID=3366194 RepID=UPI0037B6F9D9
MNGAGALEVTTPTDREIVLTRVFDAPRRMVFDAWTRPELLVRWYGARGWNLVVCEVDLRVGGRWRFVSRGPGGAEMGQGGVYRVVSPPGRLVHTETFDDQSYPGETLVSHAFTERDGRTTLTSTVLYATREGRDIVLGYPMARGVAEGYDRLAGLLARTPGRSGNPRPEHDLLAGTGQGHATKR